MSKGKYTLIGLLKYIMGFLFSSRKKKEEQRKKKLDKATTEIKEEFEDIDEKKEEAKKKDLGKRLDNMFD
jgi:hypothetical protein